MPFSCAKCGAQFEPMEGGHCNQCGKLFCLLHLRKDSGPSTPGKSECICSACADQALGPVSPSL